MHCFRDLENFQTEFESKNITLYHLEKLEVTFPEKTKKVSFASKTEKLEPGNFRKIQKVNKQKMKRKDKFETKLSENVERALNLM